MRENYLLIFFIALSILLLVIALKKVLEKYTLKRDSSIKEEVIPESKLYCEKISRDEFDYQSEMLTRGEIQKLVSSDGYHKIAQSTGNDLTKWNWQAYEKT